MTGSVVPPVLVPLSHVPDVPLPSHSLPDELPKSFEFLANTEELVLIISPEADGASDGVKSRDPRTEGAAVEQPAAPLLVPKSFDWRGDGRPMSCEPRTEIRGERLVMLVNTFSVPNDMKLDGSFSTGDGSAADTSPLTKRYLNVSRNRRDIVQ